MICRLVTKKLMGRRRGIAVAGPGIAAAALRHLPGVCGPAIVHRGRCIGVAGWGEGSASGALHSLEPGNLVTWRLDPPLGAATAGQPSHQPAEIQLSPPRGGRETVGG